MNKGNRADLDKRYYDGVRDLCASVGGDAAPAGSLADLKKQAASPVAVDARLPADDASVAKAAALYEPAVDAFLGWCADDQHELKPGMQVTSTYARDTKVRANNYGILADCAATRPFGGADRAGRKHRGRRRRAVGCPASQSGARARGIRAASWQPPQ